MRFPRTVHLLVWTEAPKNGVERVHQSVHKSGKAAKEEASRISKIWREDPNAETTGSIRSGRIFSTLDGVVYTLRLEKITDPFIVQKLWRYKQEAS